jgi:hypothetical protein
MGFFIQYLQNPKANVSTQNSSKRFWDYVSRTVEKWIAGYQAQYRRDNIDLTRKKKTGKRPA